ncbi:HTH 36 domain containing protein [Sulfitobacter noctilucae]|uniref:helix-turn-helix domain-containing protein n=1 Tax=Sulfitobacter noctilucae TaxID=1342302 RepID=UPI00046AEA66|nr:helix-turn-helix domain-containing protein [Sulfitobacter noctilucae]KIN65544.1 HTH 36 domain containing protein [Sulfitobacter noctilucae]
MSELPKFCDIKLQYLLEMVTDHQLDDNALRVAVYLTLAHADHRTGVSYPSFQTIGAAIGKHAKSVKRALNKVEAAGYMTIKRGTNKGNSSRYRPTEATLKRAAERRRDDDKVVPLSYSEREHFCPQSGTGLAGIGRQDRPPNKEQELRKKQGDESTPGLPYVGLPGEKCPSDKTLVFLPRGIVFVRDWDARLALEGMATLERSLPLSPHGHHLGFWLPGRIPAPAASAEWQAQLRILRNLIRQAQESAPIIGERKHAV